ncbi:helix-turn-helix transcriptional regulator [Ureibacillus composti]
MAKQQLNLNLTIDIPEGYVLLTKEEYVEISGKRALYNTFVKGNKHQHLYISRKERKLKQRDVAKILSIAPETYSKKENGDKDFTLSEAFLLADFFNTTVDFLFMNKLKT